MKNAALKIAGALNLLTALLHLTGGQVTLVDPLIGSDLSAQVITELVGAWHMVTIVLFATAFILLKGAFRGTADSDRSLFQFVGWLYVLFAIPSLLGSFWFSVFAPQWILLFPIGALTLWYFKENA